MHICIFMYIWFSLFLKKGHCSLGKLFSISTFTPWLLRGLLKPCRSPVVKDVHRLCLICHLGSAGWRKSCKLREGDWECIRCPCSQFLALSLGPQHLCWLWSERISAAQTAPRSDSFPAAFQGVGCDNAWLPSHCKRWVILCSSS